MRRRSEFGGAGGASGVYPVSDRDRGLLRDLAQRVAEVAALPVQAERARLWRALNLHRPERAMVLAQIGPRIHHPALECEDSLCRQWEAGLRWKLFRHENVRDDYPCTDYFDIGHAVEVGDYGVKEGKIYADPIQFPKRMARETVTNIITYINGDEVPAVTLIPTKLYRKADAEADPELKPQAKDE